MPGVHTHELYIDKSDNLYGEGGYYDAQANNFYHYLWVYTPGGKIDTVVGMKKAYVHQDFSLARDKNGNEYYVKRFLFPFTDTSHIYRKRPKENETIFATGNFKNLNWLHPQDDGSLLYALNNAIYRVDSMGKTQVVKKPIVNTKPSFKFSGNSITLWGVWQDGAKNIYVAVFSHQAVKKIEPDGTMTDVYKSTGKWAPLHGAFDDDNNLWVLEGSDKNEVKVTKVETILKARGERNEKNASFLPYIIVGCVIVGIVTVYLKFGNVAGRLTKMKS